MAKSRLNNFQIQSNNIVNKETIVELIRSKAYLYFSDREIVLLDMLCISYFNRKLNTMIELLKKIDCRRYTRQELKRIIKKIQYDI